MKGELGIILSLFLIRLNMMKIMIIIYYVARDESFSRYPNLVIGIQEEGWQHR